VRHVTKGLENIERVAPPAAAAVAAPGGKRPINQAVSDSRAMNSPFLGHAKSEIQSPIAFSNVDLINGITHALNVVNLFVREPPIVPNEIVISAN
jgi:hypothetical protein